jgi:hypothetical protein
VRNPVSGYCHLDRREKFSRFELKWKNIRAARDGPRRRLVIAKSLNRER